LCIHISTGWGSVGIIFNRMLIYRQQVMLKVCLNNNVLGFTKVSKTQRNIGLLCAVLKVMSYSF